jgi:hypothetical protein
MGDCAEQMFQQVNKGIIGYKAKELRGSSRVFALKKIKKIKFLTKNFLEGCFLS